MLGPIPGWFGVNDTGDADTYSVDVYTASACYGKKFGEDIRGELAHFVSGSSFQEPFAVKHHASVRKKMALAILCRLCPMRLLPWCYSIYRLIH